MKKSSITILLILLTTSIVWFSSCSDESKLVSFAWQNHPPSVPRNPTPGDESANNHVSVTLSWSCFDPDKGDNLKYDVLAGQENPPEKIWVRETTQNSFELGYCTPNTMWYWQVIARDNRNGVTKGPVWCFTTCKWIMTHEMN